MRSISLRPDGDRVHAPSLLDWAHLKLAYDAFLDRPTDPTDVCDPSPRLTHNPERNRQRAARLQQEATTQTSKDDQDGGRIDARQAQDVDGR